MASPLRSLRNQERPVSYASSTSGKACDTVAQMSKSDKWFAIGCMFVSESLAYLIGGPLGLIYALACLPLGIVAFVFSQQQKSQNKQPPLPLKKQKGRQNKHAEEAQRLAVLADEKRRANIKWAAIVMVLIGISCFLWRYWPGEESFVTFREDKYQILDFAPDQPLIINIYIVNSGPHEAKAVDWRMAGVIAFNEPDSLETEQRVWSTFVANVVGEKPIPGTDLMPNEGRWETTRGPVISSHDFDNLKQGIGTIFVLGMIDFEDDSGTVHTNACYFLQEPGDNEHPIWRGCQNRYKTYRRSPLTNLFLDKRFEDGWIRND
jgi:hypothetical protein